MANDYEIGPRSGIGPRSETGPRFESYICTWELCSKAIMSGHASKRGANKVKNQQNDRSYRDLILLSIFFIVSLLLF